jgi:hypothetical protein
MGSSADGEPTRIPDGDGMPFIISTLSPSGDLDGYRRVSAALPERPDGMIARYAGESDGALSITVVWETRAQADRFLEQHLLPAIRQVGGEATQPSTVISFDATDVVS